jgi:hypothetical protein
LERELGRWCGSRGRTWSDACAEMDAYVDAVWSWMWKRVDRRLDMLYSLSDQSHVSFSIFLPFVDDHELFPSTVVVVLSLS